jgi:hypothetical protein
MRNGRSILWALALWPFLAALAGAGAGPDADSSKPALLPLQHGRVENIAPDQSSLQVLHEGRSYVLAVKAPELKSTLRQFARGDLVDIGYSQDGPANVLAEIGVAVVELPVWTRVVTLLLSAAGLLLLFRILLGSRLPDLVLGADNRYSKSKLQMAGWFFLLVTSYVAATCLRAWYGGLDFVGGISIPQNLLILSGLSALTFAAAKAITQTKVDAASRAIAQGAAPPTAMPKQRADRPTFPGDLFRDDEGRVDLGDFQAVIVTLLAVAVYLLTVVGFLGSLELHRTVTLPDVDSTVLAAFGLGQGAYLVKKLVGDAGGVLPARAANASSTARPKLSEQPPTTT